MSGVSVPTVCSPLEAFDLGGRLVVITGASQGIGRTLAEAAAGAGALVLLAARNETKLEEVRAAIGPSAYVQRTDVTSMDELEALRDRASTIASEHDCKLVLVNNAGFGFTKLIDETTKEDWDTLFDASAKATFFASQKIGSLMVKAGYGKIINMSSTWSRSSDPGKVVYSAAKAAVSSLTAGMAVEWAKAGVRVNALAPTTTMTEFTANVMKSNPERAVKMRERIRMGRFAQPEDLIGAMVFLASHASDFVTGQTLFVDGGWTAASC